MTFTTLNMLSTKMTLSTSMTLPTEKTADRNDVIEAVDRQKCRFCNNKIDFTINNGLKYLNGFYKKFYDLSYKFIFNRCLIF